MVTLEILRQTLSSDPLGGQGEPQKIGEITGYLDMTSGTDDTKGTNNAFVEDSTHILLTRDFDSGITKNDKVRFDGKVFLVQFVDDPVNIRDHLEIYLKFEDYVR